MREIKFRGQREDNGEWIKGSLIQLNSGLCYITQNIHGLHLPLTGNLLCEFTHKVAPGTVGQFTGLKDKNGVEVYEGDVISQLVTSTPTDAFSQFTIKFIDGCFKKKDKGNGSPLGWVASCCIEVIGNIHENPELLEQNA